MRNKRHNIGNIIWYVLILGVCIGGLSRIVNNYRIPVMTEEELEIAISEHSPILIYSPDDIPDAYQRLWIVPKADAKDMKSNLPLHEKGLCVLAVDENEIENVFQSVSQKPIHEIRIRDINVHDFNALSYMTCLNILHYDNYSNRDSDENRVALDFEGTFPALQDLQITYTSLSSLGSLSVAENIKCLDLSSTNLTDITELGFLAGVEELNLSRTNVRDIKALGNMRNLRKLYLDYAFVADISALSDMEHLEILSVSQNYYHDNRTEGELVQDLTPLSGKKELRELILYGSEVRDISPLKSCSSLERLDLSYTPLESLDTIQYLPALKMVEFYHCDCLPDSEVDAFEEWYKGSGKELVINGYIYARQRK